MSSQFPCSILFQFTQVNSHKELAMLQRNIFLQVFIVVALSSIGQASAGKVVGSADTKLGSSNEAGKSMLKNKNRRLVGVKGRRRSSGKGGGKGGSKGKGKVSSHIRRAAIDLQVKVPAS
jgi:hypothetical protein